MALRPGSAPTGDAEATTRSNGARPGYFPLIQAMRGLAALWVVLFHSSQSGAIGHLMAALPAAVTMAVFEAGHLGVPIFFALSGFVIAHSLRDAAPSWGMAGRFALRRSIRLDPPYWASIAIVVALGFVSARVKSEGWAPPGVGRVLAHVGYLQELLHVRELDTVYWTLTYEVQFYLFFVLTLVGCAKLFSARQARRAAWGTFYLLALASALGAFDRLPQGVFLALWTNFLVGALAYVAARRRAARPFFLLLVAIQLTRAAFDGGAFAAVSASAALLFFWSLVRGFAETALNDRVFQLLGAISYSLYLVHAPVTGATAFVLDAGGLRGTPLREAAALLVILVASVGAAAVLWRLVELPAHRLSRRALAGARR